MTIRAQQFTINDLTRDCSARGWGEPPLAQCAIIMSELYLNLHIYINSNYGG